MKFHWTSTPYDNCFRSRAVWLKQAKSRIEYKVGDPSKKKDKRNTTHIHKTAWAKGSKQPYLTALGLWTPPVCCASVFSQLAFRLHFRSEIPYISNICSSKAGRPWASSQQIVEGKKYISLLTHFTSQETRSTKSKAIGRHQDFADDVNPTEKSSQMNVLSQTEEGKGAEQQKIASRCAGRSSRCVAWRPRPLKAQCTGSAAWIPPHCEGEPLEWGGWKEQQSELLCFSHHWSADED